MEGTRSNGDTQAGEGGGSIGQEFRKDVGGIYGDFLVG